MYIYAFLHIYMLTTLLAFENIGQLVAVETPRHNLEFGAVGTDRSSSPVPRRSLLAKVCIAIIKHEMRNTYIFIAYGMPYLIFDIYCVISNMHFFVQT
jgi:hypothetical protein